MHECNIINISNIINKFNNFSIINNRTNNINNINNLNIMYTFVYYDEQGILRFFKGTYLEVYDFLKEHPELHKHLYYTFNPFIIDCTNLGDIFNKE